MAIQSEFVAGHKISAPRRPLDHQRWPRFGLHSKFGRSLGIIENLLQPIRLFATVWINSVKANGVAAREIIDFKWFICLPFQLMRHRSGSNRIHDRLFGLKILGRFLKGMVPERELGGAHGLGLSPL